MSLLSPQMSLLVQPLICRAGGVEEVGLFERFAPHPVPLPIGWGEGGRRPGEGFGFFARLVNVFERLKRQDGGANLAGFAVPDEFHLALVVKEEEAVFLRQRLALLNQFDEVALFGFGEFVFVRVGAGHNQEMIEFGSAPAPCKQCARSGPGCCQHCAGIVQAAAHARA